MNGPFSVTKEIVEYLRQGLNGFLAQESLEPVETIDPSVPKSPMSLGIYVAPKAFEADSRTQTTHIVADLLLDNGMQDQTERYADALFMFLSQTRFGLGSQVVYAEIARQDFSDSYNRVAVEISITPNIFTDGDY